MNKEKFKETLEENRNAPLCGRISKYQHIKKLGDIETEGILNGMITVMPKIDGANLTIAWTEKQGHIICSRNGVISIDNEPATGFRGAVQYVLNHPGLLDLAKKYIIRGEWLVKHTINYPPDIMNHFYVFDLEEYNGNREYKSFIEIIPILQNMSIRYVPVLAELPCATLERLYEFLPGQSVFKEIDSDKEGIVIKNFDFINKFGRVQWGKIVNADFKIKNKIAFNTPGKNVETEVHFVATYITSALVLKTIEKIKTDRYDKFIDIQCMGEILGRVWYDVVNEEIWNYVKKYKVGIFDFKRAQKLCVEATKSIAIDYFNTPK